MILVISYIFMFLCVLVCVAFYTLLERKILGYVQIRKGPNKVGVGGLLQPFSDGMKLFIKELIFPLYSNKIIFYMSPMVGLFLSFCFWTLVFLPFFHLTFSFGLIMFLVISSFGVYPILGAGWGSNSVYGLLGAYRAVAQTISYEVSLALVLFSLTLVGGSFNVFTICELGLAKFIFFILLMGIWLISCLAETNRSPFDFAEGESELVSGFNIEYGSGGFGLIFIAEYSNIIFLSVLSCLLFFYFNLLLLIGYLIMVFFLWARGSYPRYRYDCLMMLAWKSFLPLVLSKFIFCFGLLLILV